MGRKKAKKSKSGHGGGGGHKRHVSSSQSESGEGANNVRAPKATPAPAGAVASVSPNVETAREALVKEESKLNVAQAVPSLLASAKERESPSPPRLTNRNINLRPKQGTGKRAQMQGQLNGLEAELAVVEDLQARMAAKLCALDANLAEKEQEEEEARKREGSLMEEEDKPAAAAAATAVTPASPQSSSSSPEKDETLSSKPKSQKKKNKKKSKQDKAHKQEENMKEAQQMREAALLQEMSGEDACACPILKLEKVDPGTTLDRAKASDVAKHTPEDKSTTSVKDDWENEELLEFPAANKDLEEGFGSGQKEEIQENTPKVKEENEEILVRVKRQDIQAIEMKEEVQENEEKPSVIVEIEVVDVSKDKQNEEEVEFVKDEGRIFGEDVSGMKKEVALYLQQEYNRMVNVHSAFCEEMALLPQILGMKITSAEPLTTPPSATAGQFFSYADAVKSSLKAECEQQDRKSHLEEAEAKFHEAKAAICPGTDSTEHETYVLKYMKNEFEPCLRKLEAEEAEIVFYEAIQKDKERKASSEITPKVEAQLVSDIAMETPRKESPVCSKETDVKSSKPVCLSMAADYEQIHAMKHCVDAEMCHQELLTATQRKPGHESVETKKKRTTPTKPELSPAQTAIEVAKYLKEEMVRMENLRVAEQGEKQHQEKLQRGGLEEEKKGAGSDAARMTAMLEAATMEVEYDRVEQEFLLQREQQRQQPWRWVRADTAPAYISVPETVLEPTSDAEEDAEIPSSTMVQTDLAGLVFQCRDSCNQTEGRYVECCQCGEMALPWDQQFALRLQEEMAQRKTLENMVRLLEAEAADQRQRLYQQRKFADELENSITDKKAEATEAKLLAMEYKSRCQDLEQSLDTARSLNNPDENAGDIFQTSELDSAIIAKINSLKAKEPQGRVEDLEAKLALSKSGVQSILDNLSDPNKQEELMPITEHQQQLDQVETRCYQLQLKVTQLEAELAKVQNVRDVWGSNHQGSTSVQGGSLEMAFQALGTSTHQPVYTLPPSVLSKTSTSSVDLPPIANVDLPPVTGLHGGAVPSCLSGLRGLGSSSPGGEGSGLGTSLSELAGSAGMECGTLSSGLLSGLSDLQAKATPPVVAPLAMQEDMDSDDDVSWSSASEHIKDMSHSAGQSRASPAPGTPLSPCFHSSKSCLPPHTNSLHGQSVMLPTCMAVAQQQQQHQQQQMHSPGPVSHVSPRRMSPVGPVSHASPGHVASGRPVSHISPHRMSPTGHMSLASPHSMSAACRPVSQTATHQMPHFTEGMMCVGSPDQTNSPPKAKGSKKKNRSKKYSK